MGSDKQKLVALAVVVALLGCVATICEASHGFPYPMTPREKKTIPALGLGLAFDYYKDTKCRGVEKTVRRVVKEEVDRYPGIGAGLIRLFFHDCFVEGCDASVLLKATKDNPQPEMLGIPNINSLRGFEVIDKAKDALGEECREVVSCADILAFAARDATVLLGKVKHFEMPAGRYDGKRSLASDTLPNLPPPFADVATLKAMFLEKGLNTDEMVVLSGAHTIGISHCSSFGSRINASNPSDMDPNYASELRAKCNNQPTNTVNQDFKTPDDLDRQYYQNVLDKKVLFESDAALLSSSDTEGAVKEYAEPSGKWEEKFQEAMVKMGNIGVKSKGNDAEIRKVCGSVNY
ncbi:peroxidase 2 [Brachypodium distachyon]|uniref:Peroxidase n=1 Tax=Brachypodium distachyon TaxID=15368 RepID=I1GRW1_BRADI|nr:peroxidase 2 [Brachypodium distachyon]KQK14993.1 hypothetical protein BRADI_1g20020v3 [Brachypodium distachyon]|eukprot:XP_003559903.1 peroxidase 2 [Brachypodium distachyon]